MVDIEKLENLPFKENKSANLTRRYGNVYNVLDYRRFSDKMKSPYNISKVILKANIGKSFDMAFHYYCTKVDKQHQHIFLDNFNIQRRWRNYGYFIDEQGNIQNTPYKKYKAPVVITSADYKTELRHKITGDKITQFEEVYNTVDAIGKYGLYKGKPYKRQEFSHLEYGTNPYKMSPIGLRYKAQKADFEPVIISGWIQHFESKNDPRFKRHIAERNKAIKKSPKKVLSDAEYRAILRAKVLKDKEETRIKLEAKGMRPNAFTSIKTDINV